MNDRKIVLVVGGARSGKSSFALTMASRVRGGKAFVATAQAFDEEMRQRIERHRKERGSGWDEYEEPMGVVDLIMDIQDKYDVILIDCLTLWLSNVMIREESTKQRAQMIEIEIERFLDSLRYFKRKSLADGQRSVLSYLLLVSNEVGMGIVPENELARRFRDAAGTLNQKVAEIADDVYTVIAGIPVKIK
jgi:adenosylcobinamide kinase/adenosylcobinamide-phosphate guanylyltransferase